MSLFHQERHHHSDLILLGLAEFALSRKDPAYVGRAKEVQKAEKAREAGQCMGEAFTRAERHYA